MGTPRRWRRTLTGNATRRRFSSAIVARAAAVVVASGTAIALSGCVGGARPSPTPTPSVTHSATPTPSAAPTLDPNGTAESNLAYFDLVNERTIQATGDPTSRQLIDGLVQAGFDKAAMQVSADKTTVDLKPGSIQFSVKMGDRCLIGQFGTEIGGYHSQVADPISTGACLIGDTVPITW